MVINMTSRVQAVGHKVAVHSWPQSVDVDAAQKRQGDGVGSAPTLNWLPAEHCDAEML